MEDLGDYKEHGWNFVSNPTKGTHLLCFCNVAKISTLLKFNLLRSLLWFLTVVLVLHLWKLIEFVYSGSYFATRKFNRIYVLWFLTVVPVLQLWNLMEYAFLVKFNWSFLWFLIVLHVSIFLKSYCGFLLCWNVLLFLYFFINKQN